MRQSKISLVFISFKKAWTKSPQVLKPVSLNFGFYLLAVSFLFFFLSSGFFSLDSTTGRGQFFNLNSLLNFSLLSFSHIFTVFMIPYYAYKSISNSTSPNFWDFISRTVYPIVIAHIKAILVILLFSLLLILPGVYKKIRFTFLNETVFFDGEKSGSVLKKADQATRSLFWPVLLFLSLSAVGSFCVTSLLSLCLKMSPAPSFLSSILKLATSFYLSCFILLWRSFFYFEIKKFKGESISL